MFYDERFYFKGVPGNYTVIFIVSDFINKRTSQKNEGRRDGANAFRQLRADFDFTERKKRHFYGAGGIF